MQGFSNLRAEMARNKDNIENLSQEMGISYNSLLNRLHGKVEFTISDAKFLTSRYEATFEYLFKKG